METSVIVSKIKTELRKSSDLKLITIIMESLRGKISGISTRLIGSICLRTSKSSKTENCGKRTKD